MIEKHKKVYELSVDEFDEETGWKDTAVTENPAILSSGYAFENVIPIKEYSFDGVNDDLKYRITAPVLIPNLLIERKGEKDDGSDSYFVYFSEESAEKVYKKFMKNVGTKMKYNIKHTNQIVDGYLFETYILDNDHKLNMAKEMFNEEYPLNTIIMTLQFNNEKDFLIAVENKLVGKSLEGRFNEILKGTVQVEMEYINKNTEKTMIKQVINNNFYSFSEMEEGKEVLSFEDTADKDFSFSYEGKTIEVKDLKIVSVKLEKEEDETTVKEDVKEDIKEDETTVKEDVKAEEKKEVIDVNETQSLSKEEIISIVKNELNEIYSLLADLKAKSSETPKVTDEIVDEIFEKITEKKENKKTDHIFELVKSNMVIKQ